MNTEAELMSMLRWRDWLMARLEAFFCGFED